MSFNHLINPSILQYLTASIAGTGQDGHTVPLLNPGKPRSGIHLCDHMIFNAGKSLLCAAYFRNTFDNGNETPKGIKACLKLIFNSGQVVESLEIDPTYFSEIHKVLVGRSKSTAINTKDKSYSKSLRIFHGDSSTALVAQISSDKVNISISLQAMDIVHLQALMMTVLKVHYPWLSDAVMYQFLSHERGYHHTENAPQQGFEQEGAEPPDLNEKELEWTGDPGEAYCTEKQRRAIYAIGINNGFPADSAVVVWLQENLKVSAANALIRQANQGDLSFFERAENQLAGNSEVASVKEWN